MLDWYKFDSHYYCVSPNKVNLLLMNGREDYVVDPAGTVNLDYGPLGEVYSTGFPPIEYTVWYMASLN